MYVSLQGHPNPHTLAVLDDIVGAVKSLPEITHSSNGLLLCQCISPEVVTSRCYLVCNPTTQSYKLLPSRHLPCVLRAFLAFDPSKSPHYKVVVMGLYPRVQIDIYFSEKKMLELPNPPKIDRVDKIRYFGECGGRLTLILTNTLSAMAFRILEMEKDYWRWIVKFQVNLGPLISVFPEWESTIHYYSILGFVEGEKDFGLVLTI
ncbi:hypothetical protein RHSIM_Rhsim08G0073100 [Rhododendron simsii]|uniref:F-box protein n=1 Tax=Rhododendron simsii TaxID=118357 RepID=A0A834GKJ9_RHOSS|nr:hypothetical protein RHSIM_Rhsim08G0073100 [Rhododendron simsii]